MAADARRQTVPAVDHERVALRAGTLCELHRAARAWHQGPAGEFRVRADGDVMGAKVRYEAADGVAVITLNEPPANTYSYEMMRELDAAILDARMDAAVQVIVITG